MLCKFKMPFQLKFSSSVYSTKLGNFKFTLHKLYSSCHTLFLWYGWSRWSWTTCSLRPSAIRWRLMGCITTRLGRLQEFNSLLSIYFADMYNIFINSSSSLWLSTAHLRPRPNGTIARLSSNMTHSGYLFVVARVQRIDSPIFIN